MMAVNNPNTQIMQQMAANQAAQQQAQAQAQSKDPMRDIVNEMIKNKLVEQIEAPKEMTIGELLKSNLQPNANTTERLANIAAYLDSSEAQRNLGNLMGERLFNKYTGRFENTGDRLYNQKQIELKEAQAQAYARQQAQQKLANDMYGYYQQKDIKEAEAELKRELAKQQLDWAREKFGQELALDRARTNAQIQHQRNMEALGWYNARQRGLGGSGGITGGATGGASGVNLNNVKMTAAERKSLTENKTTLANIESGLKALEKNPDAYQWYKGILGPDIANRIDPKGVGTRTQIDNITAVYRKWLTGAQMSDKERKAYERFLPAPTDNYNIVKAKLKGMQGAVQRSNDAILSNYGLGSAGSSDPMGLGL